MAERVEIDIIARTEKAVAGLDKLLKSLAATYISYRALKDFLVSSVKEALEAERAFVALGSSLRASGQNAEIYTKQLSGLARALSMTTTFAEEETMVAMQSLTQIGRVSAEGMKKVIPVVQDLAAGLGVNLNSAALLVGKAIEGNVGALGRYGIKIKETADPAERFSNIIKALTERFGGMSEAMAKSASGGLAQIKNEFNELKEAVGTRLLQAFSGTISSLASMMKKSTIMATDIKDIGSVEEAMAYVKILESWFDKAEEAKNKVGKSFGKDSTQYYLAGMEISEVEKRIRELNGLINELKKRPKAVGVSGSLLPGVSDDAADKLKKTELTSYAFLDALSKLRFAEEDYIITTFKAGQATYDFDEAMKRIIASSGGMSETISKLSSRGRLKPFGGESGGGWGMEEAVVASQKLQEKIQELYGWMQKAADAAISIGTSLATGDAAGAFQKLISESMGLLIQFALMAASKAYFMGDMANFAMWIGVAGLGVGASILGGAMSANAGDKNIPAMAGGGIVTSPTLALIGEKGPEAVVPLGRGVGGTVINVYGSIWQTQDLARAVAGAQSRW